MKIEDQAVSRSLEPSPFSLTSGELASEALDRRHEVLSQQRFFDRQSLPVLKEDIIEEDSPSESST